jgi:TonB family protein
MFQLRQGIRRRPGSVSLLTLALCVIVLAAGAGSAREAHRDSGSLIKPAMIKPPTALSQNNNSRKTGTGRRRKRRVRRARSSVAARRVAGKPREVKGVIVDSEDSMPNNAPVPVTPPLTPPRLKPRGPISGGVLNGRAISLPLPPYPPIARAAKASGTVAVRVLIDEDGKVTEAQAVSGPALLRKAAEEAARNARFAPTQLSGQPVKVTGVITYNFVPE